MGTAQVVQYILALGIAGILSLTFMRSEAIHREEAIRTEVLADLSGMSRTLQERLQASGSYAGAVPPSRTVFGEFETEIVSDSLALIHVHAPEFLRGTLRVDPSGVSFTFGETLP